MKKAIVGNGLGFGDDGKGGVTHWLCAQHKAHTVVRIGGPQGAHWVFTANGAKHMHTQFSSGTLAGAATHLSKNMVIEPIGILNEGKSLMYEHGLRGIFNFMTIHEDALVVTPFQAIANRLRELARGANRYGSVGIGVGETVIDAEVMGVAAIRVKDLEQPYLAKKLEDIRCQKLKDLAEIIAIIDELPEESRDRTREEVAILSSQQSVERTVKKFEELASRVKIVDTDYFADKILNREGTIIFESSQGVLIDRYYGFHPYTTKVRVMPETALALLRECGYDGEVKRLGIMRAYHIRHGAGPFVSENADLTKRLPDEVNGDHPWQGSFRVGHFDTVAARYAIDACGGSKALDGLVVTCVDRLPVLVSSDNLPGSGPLKFCESYIGPNDADSFFLAGKGIIKGIRVSHGSDDEQLQDQEKLGQLLFQCQPNLSTVCEIPDGISMSDLARLYAKVIAEKLRVPVVAASVGPTERDKIEFSSL